MHDLNSKADAEQRDDVENSIDEEALETPNEAIENRNRKCCRPYNGNKEAMGWAFITIPVGTTTTVQGLYVGSALLYLASNAAGCAMGDKECEGRVYGFRPSSLLTMIQTLVGISASLLMPLFGAIADHTKYRRALGRCSTLILTALLLAMSLLLTQDTWFIVACLYAMAAFTFIVHNLAAYAYLPELTKDKELLRKYIASFSAIQYCSMIIYVATMIGITNGLGISNILATTRIALNIAFTLGLIFFSLSWFILFRPRPAAHKVPEGQLLVTSGFRKLSSTLKDIASQSAAIRWFLCANAFIDAAVGSFFVVFITFVNHVLQLTASESSTAALFVLFGTIPGSVLSPFLAKKMNPIRSLQVCLILWIVVTAAGAAVLRGAGQLVTVCIFSVFWGFLTGWVFPTERAAYCSIIPRGQEAELMGLYLCANDILSWLPPLVFTAFNEAGLSMNISIVSLNIFFFLGICFLSLVNYRKAVEAHG